MKLRTLNKTPTSQGQDNILLRNFVTSSFRNIDCAGNLLLPCSDAALYLIRTSGLRTDPVFTSAVDSAVDVTTRTFSHRICRSKGDTGILGSVNPQPTHPGHVGPPTLRRYSALAIKLDIVPL